MTNFGWKYCAGMLLTLCCSSLIRLAMLGLADANSNTHNNRKTKQISYTIVLSIKPLRSLDQNLG